MSVDLLERIGKDKFIQLANECNTLAELEGKANAGYRYIVLALTKLGMLDDFKKKSKQWVKAHPNKPNLLTAKEYCEQFFNSNSIKFTAFKKKLIEAGYKENKCECCGISEWNGHPISLQLHHIDGNHYNNKLENLQFLCPNCHTQTDNYGSKNASNKEASIGFIPKYSYINIFCKCDYCGKEFHKCGNKSKHNFCSNECAVKYVQNKIPTKETLLELRKTLNNTQIGNLYNVTSSAVKYWVRKYHIQNIKGN